MTLLRPIVLSLVALLLAAACSSDKTSREGRSTNSSKVAACSKESAAEVRQYVVTASGFSVTCGRATKGTDVLFINDGDTPAEVSLAKSGPDDFNAQLPNRGSTYAHRFDTPGTFVVRSMPNSEVTLFITE